MIELVGPTDNFELNFVCPTCRSGTGMYCTGAFGARRSAFTHPRRLELAQGLRPTLETKGVTAPVRPSFESIYMRMAVELAKRSTCSRLHVGCVIASADFRQVLAVGYNGNASGLPNECDSTEPGRCGCLAPGTLVTATDVQRAYRRRYVGDMLRIVTRHNDFTVTPNHPVLALGKGFVAASLLEKGDNLLHPFGGQEVPAAAPNNYDRVPIEQVFETLFVSGVIVRRAGAKHDFHNDGSVDENVDIVSIDCSLRDASKSRRSQLITQPTLTVADQIAAELGVTRPSQMTVDIACAARFSRSSLRHNVNPSFLQPCDYSCNADAQRVRNAVGGFSGSISRDDFFNRQYQHSLSLVPAKVLSKCAQDTAFSQALLNDCMRDPIAFGQHENSLAAAIASDEIVHVERYSWSGHVFNLQTGSGWYCAGKGSTVVENCLHSETNAIINCRAPREQDKVVFVTDLPCKMCSKALVNLGGVTQVFYLREYRLRDGEEVLKKVGIPIEQFLLPDV